MKIDKKIRNVIIGLLILISLIIFFFSINPLNHDEAEFAYQAKLISENGVPNVSQLWHPPLYIYLLGLHMSVFGNSDLSVRFFGYIFFIINYFLLMILLKKIIGKENNYAILIFSALYLLSPLLLQQSLVVDIDNTVHASLIFLFLIILYGVILKGSLSDYLSLSLSIAILFLSKIFTPMILLFSVVLFFIINKNIKKAYYFVLSSILGTLFFLGIWEMIRRLMNAGFMAFFDILIVRIFRDTGSFIISKKLQLAALGISWAVLWISLPIILLLLYMVFQKISRFKKTLKGFESIIFIFAFFMFLFYHFIKPTGLMTKYLIPVYSLLMVPLAIWFSNMDFKNFRIFNSRIFFGILSLLVGLCMIFLYINITIDAEYIADTYLVSDHIESYKFLPGLNNIPITLLLSGIISIFCALIIFFGKSIFGKSKLTVRFYISIIILNIAYLLFIGDYLFGLVYMNPLPLVLAFLPTIFFLALWLGRVIDLKNIIFIMLALGLSTGIALSIVQSSNDYQTQMSWTNYGESGFKQVVQEFAGQCDDHKFIMRKDFGYYICPEDDQIRAMYDLVPFNLTNKLYMYNHSIDPETVRWYTTTIFYDSEAQNNFNELLKDNVVDYIIIDPYSAPWTARPVIMHNYSLNRTIGDFEIYTRR